MTSQLPTKIATGILDKLPASVRHLAIMGIAYGLDHVAGAITALHLTPTESQAAGIGATLLALIFTPLTKQYGVGKG